MVAYISHDGSMYAIYGNMDPINIPPMLVYIPYMDPMGYWSQFLHISSSVCEFECPLFREHGHPFSIGVHRSGSHQLCDHSFGDCRGLGGVVDLTVSHDGYPLVIWHSNGKSPFLMGKSTISMAIFNSYVKLPEGSIGLAMGFTFLITSGSTQRPAAFCSTVW